MSKAIVSVVGRPNVGKSTLFFFLVQKREAITEDFPGVTRDRLYREVEWQGRYLTLADTGGYDLENSDQITNNIRKQVDMAVETSDLVLFVVDGRVGITSEDREIAEMLQRSGRKVIVVVNKIDSSKTPDTVYEFYEFGFEDLCIVSAEQSYGLGDLLDKVFSYLPEQRTKKEDGDITISIIGKPNAGKSSLLNTLVGEERMIVTDIAGTTRDAIDSMVEKDGKTYTFIDTAGLRRKRSVEAGVERYSVTRTLDAVDRSEICLLMIDATFGVTEQDTKIAGYAHENGKAMIILVNKWDVAKENTDKKKVKDEIRTKLSFIYYAPIHFISATENIGINEIYSLIEEVYSNYNYRIPTGILNEIIGEAVAKNPPPTRSSQVAKLYYVTQGSVAPPNFIVFVNDTELIHFSYLRYIENTIRQKYDFTGTPLLMNLRRR